MPSRLRLPPSPTAADRLDRALAVIRDQLSEVAAAQGRIRELAEAAVKIARGTGDVTDAATSAVLAVDLAGRVEAALKVGPATSAEIARALLAPGARVSDSIKAFRRAGRVANIGSETDPRWCWVPGDETTTAELMVAVDGLLRARPMTLRDLETFTQARRNRLSGVLVRLQRAGAPVRNLGDGRRALWSIQE